MRLNEISLLLTKALPLLDVPISDVILSGRSYINIQSANQLRKGLHYLDRTRLFDEALLSIKDSNMYMHAGDNITVENSEGVRIRSVLADIRTAGSLLLQAINKATTPDSEFTVHIKLPVISTLPELAERITSFEKIFSQVILDPSINGIVQFEGVETGSNWVKIFVGCRDAVLLIGSMAWSAAVIHKKTIEAKADECRVHSMKIDNEHKETVTKAYKMILDAFVEKEVQYIMDEHLSDTVEKNEVFGRVKNSLKMLSEELARGAEVHPPLMAPEEVTNLFPDMKLLPTIDSKVKNLPAPVAE